MGFNEWFHGSEETTNAPRPVFVDHQRAGQEAGDLAGTTHSVLRSWNEARPARPPAPLPTDPVQAAIDTVEIEMNKKRASIEDLCEQVRPDALSRELPSLRGAQRVAVKKFLDDWLPIIAEMRAEYAQLCERHSSLLREKAGCHN